MWLFTNWNLSCLAAAPALMFRHHSGQFLSWNLLAWGYRMPGSLLGFSCSWLWGSYSLIKSLTKMTSMHQGLLAHHLDGWVFHWFIWRTLTKLFDRVPFRTAFLSLLLPFDEHVGELLQSCLVVCLNRLTVQSIQTLPSSWAIDTDALVLTAFEERSVANVLETVNLDILDLLHKAIVNTIIFATTLLQRFLKEYMIEGSQFGSPTWLMAHSHYRSLLVHVVFVGTLPSLELLPLKLGL